MKFRSWDAQGNAEAVQTQVIQAPQDTAPPTTTISCNAAACGTDPYLNSVTIGLTPTDTGGSGVDKTYYTTNGSTPTTSSTVYSAPFQVTALGNTTVKFFSTDKAGNAEAVQSQQVTVVPATTRVVLEFDNSSISLYSLGYQQALQPHGAKATFFVQSGSVLTNRGGATQMSLGAARNARRRRERHRRQVRQRRQPHQRPEPDHAGLRRPGGHPVARADAGRLRVPGRREQRDRAGDRQGLRVRQRAGHRVGHRVTATGQLVRHEGQCAGNGDAGEHAGGGQHRRSQRRPGPARDRPGVLPDTSTRANYTSCSAASGHVELGDLNSFLDWMANAGQAGGAPAGAALSRSAPRRSGGHDGSDDEHRVQRRCLLEHAVLRRGERDARPPPTRAPACPAPTTPSTAATRRWPARRTPVPSTSTAPPPRRP